MTVLVEKSIEVSLQLSNRAEKSNYLANWCENKLIDSIDWLIDFLFVLSIDWLIGWCLIRTFFLPVSGKYAIAVRSLIRMMSLEPSHPKVAECRTVCLGFGKWLCNLLPAARCNGQIDLSAAISDNLCIFSPNFSDSTVNGVPTAIQDATQAALQQIEQFVVVPSGGDASQSWWRRRTLRCRIVGIIKAMLVVKNAWYLSGFF